LRDGLCHEFAGTQGQRQLALAQHGTHNHGDTLRAGAVLEQLQNFPAVSVGHHDVEGNRLGRLLGGKSQRFLCA